ncbi:MAG: asparaginase [Candidatus Eisenbacteria bacterium]|nr:asparaginase [Candidatus Eisenbacteria bacterium]
MRFELEVLVRRGSAVESRHHLQCAAVDASGTLLAGTPNAGLVTMFRSSAKPFQLLPLVERGHAERLGFTDEQLAVMAASHTGSRYHVQLVTGILEQLGLGPGALACGYHDPEDAGSRDDLLRGGAPRTALYNNCSGKHAGMLALALAEGWPIEGYHLPAHPMQQLLRQVIAEVCEISPASMESGTDGCNLPVFALPLPSMARGYARLAAARADAPEARTRALARIARAMGAHPRTVEGDGRTATQLMLATGGRVVAKGGAEGLMLLALTDRGTGVAVKCEDGAGRALAPTAVAVLERLGALDGAELATLAPQRRPVVRNVIGAEVGRLEPSVREVALA